MVSQASALTRRPELGLVWELVLRSLRLRYRRSVLGALWAQLAPLAQVAVLTVIFTRIVPLGIEDYAAFVLVGLLPWLWFQAALLAGTSAVLDAPDLVRHPGFPRETLPIVAVTSTLAHHLLALPVAVGAAVLATGRLPVTAVAIVPLLAIQALLCLGPSFALAAAHARLRDTAHIVGVVLVPLFYATPVFYDAADLDAAPILRLNPLTPLVDGYRDALLRGDWPPLLPLVATAAFGAVLLVGGLTLYRRRMGRFLEEM